MGLPRMLVGLAVLRVAASCGGTTSPSSPTSGDDGGCTGPSCTDAASTGFHDLGDSSKWSFLDMGGLGGPDACYGGTAFDGRYLYLGPGCTTPALRYDTSGDLGSSGDWTPFDVGPFTSGKSGYGSAAFDGRTVYFAPYSAPPVLLAYSVNGAFDDAGAWSAFTTTKVASDAREFGGAVLAGHQLVLVPDGQSVAAGWDTSAKLSDLSAWQHIDLGTQGTTEGYFGRGVFDGQYVYLAPLASVVFRLDARQPLSSASSWTKIDLKTLRQEASGYGGAAFDGRYVYLVPHFEDDNPAFPHGLVARFDTRADFRQTGSWSFFDTRAVHPDARAFGAASFDGRYVYFVPYQSSVIARLDIQGDFSNAASWSAFDIGTLNARASEFSSAAFDGRYVYLVPGRAAAYGRGVLARFDARYPPQMPPGFSGSFD